MTEHPVQAEKPGQNCECLRLLAIDAEDLAVMSAHLQDAIVRVGDMAFLPSEHRFALLAQRFDWLAAGQGRIERCQTGLHFDNVQKVELQGFDLRRKNRALNLLSMTFDVRDAPSGAVLLTFSGGGAVRIEVECLEAHMSDLDLRWNARRRPAHDGAG